MSSKRPSSEINTTPTDSGESKKGRPLRCIVWDLAIGVDWKDTVEFKMTFAKEDFKLHNDQLWLPGKLVQKAVSAHLGSDDTHSIVAVCKGDKLPLRYYLKEADDYKITNAIFQLWAVPRKEDNGEKVANWYLSHLHGMVPYRAQSHFGPTLDLWQPENAEKFTKLRAKYNMDELGRFVCAAGDERDVMSLVTPYKDDRGPIGIIWDYSHNEWNPPVRIAGSFDRVMTNSHDYVARHPQGRIRLFLHQNMFVPEDAPEAEGLGVGEYVHAGQGDESDESDDDDPSDKVVSASLRTFFAGQKRWIVEGSRRNLDAFLSEYMGCCDNAVYRMVNSGYAQYLFPKQPPSIRF